MSEMQVETKVRNKGQFKKGNPGGPGNPHAKQVARIRATLLAALDPETLCQIVCQLIDRAVRGNLEAIKILLAYSVGRPGKSDDLVELLTEHFPSTATESVESTNESEAIPPSVDSPEPHRQQTPETAETHRQQTVQTAETHRQQTAQTAETRRQQTTQTAETHRQQTAQSAETHRQQTAQTAETHRQQTTQTAETHRQQTAFSARMLTSVLLGRQQTDQTESDPLELMALIQEVLETAQAPSEVEAVNDIPLLR